MSFVWNGIKILFCVLGAYAIYQYFFMPNLLFKGRVHQPLVDPNGLAAVFSLGIFLLAGDLLKEARKIEWWNVAVLFLMLAGLFTTGSRAAFLFMAMAGLMAVAMTGFQGIGKRNWIIFGGAGLAALILIGAVYTPTFYSGPFKVLQYTSQSGLNGIFNERGLIWKASLELVKSHTWFGTGPGTFPYYYAEWRSDQDQTAGLMVHNDPLQFAVEMGILAPVFFYLVCLMAGLRSFSVLKKIGRDDERRLGIALPFAGLAAFVLHSHLTFNFHSLPCLMLAGFAFAVWYRATALASNEELKIVRPPAFLNKTALESLFLIIAFSVATIIVAPLYSQKLLNEANREMQKGEVGNLAYKINLADTISLGTNSDAYFLAANIPLGILEQANLSENDKQKFIEQARDILERGRKANPRDADFLMLQGKLAGIEGYKDEQTQFLREAVRIDPFHMPSRIALGAQLDRTGKLEEALAVMEAGMEKKYSRKDGEKYLDYYLRTKVLEQKLLEQKKSFPQKVPAK